MQVFVFLVLFCCCFFSASCVLYSSFLDSPLLLSFEMEIFFSLELAEGVNSVRHMLVPLWL